MFGWVEEVGLVLSWAAIVVVIDGVIWRSSGRDIVVVDLNAFSGALRNPLSNKVLHMLLPRPGYVDIVKSSAMKKLYCSAALDVGIDLDAASARLSCSVSAAPTTKPRCICSGSILTAPTNPVADSRSQAHCLRGFNQGSCPTRMSGFKWKIGPT